MQPEVKVGHLLGQVVHLSLKRIRLLVKLPAQAAHLVLKLGHAVEQLRGNLVAALPAPARPRGAPPHGHYADLEAGRDDSLRDANSLNASTRELFTKE